MEAKNILKKVTVLDVVGVASVITGVVLFCSVPSNLSSVKNNMSDKELSKVRIRQISGVALMLAGVGGIIYGRKK